MDIEELYQLYLSHPVILTDTRKLQPGGIFFALSGANFDGNQFARLALDSGASYAVIDNPEFAVNERCIVVPNTLNALQQLAQHHRKQLTIPVIAITGSNGKTTTKELITAVLRTRMKTYATEGNLNNHIGVPLTLLNIKLDAEIAIIEMGANHLREIASYCEVALPTHGVITNCGKAHIEGFGSVEGVRKGKGELYDFLATHKGVVFRNTDLEYLETMAQAVKKQVTYGRENATYIGKPLMNGVFLQVEVQLNNSNILLDTNLVGAYNFPNVMTAVAIGAYFGLPADDITTGIAEYRPDNSRSQWVTCGSNKIILDAYNANPSSMQSAILNFVNSPLPNKILWLGGMKEMGASEEHEHLDLVNLISKHSWKQVILVGNEFKGLHGNYLWFENSTEAAMYIKEHSPVDSSILLKGSRGSKMELLYSTLNQ